MGRDMQAINSMYGPSNPVVLMVPKGDMEKEISMNEELKKLDCVTSVVSYVNSVGNAIPSSFLPSETVSRLYSAHYSRFVITMEAEEKDPDWYEKVNDIRNIGEKYYGDKIQYAGDLVSTEDLKTTIAHATGYSSRYSLYSMVGETSEFLALQHKASRIARSDNNILLQGEPGTGKQRLAHGIHQASPRAAAPLIVVKCSNAPIEALEEEFFGSVDGDRQPMAGKLELALGGTLFLDEVEKLPVEMGDKLADALKNGLVNRETGVRKKLNVRVIAACDSNLKRLSDKGLFSKSLYELVLDTTMRVPPLRERVKDIEVIASHILAEMSAQHNLPPKRLSPEALNLLTGCSWPGNIKQLQGVIEQAFFHTPGAIIESDNIKLPGDRTLEKSWKYDKDAFIAAWKSAGGNISKLAGMLDVSRVTLYRYLKKYGLGPKVGKED